MGDRFTGVVRECFYRRGSGSWGVRGPRKGESSLVTVTLAVMVMVMLVIVMVVLEDDCSGEWDAGDGGVEVLLLKKTGGSRGRNGRANVKEEDKKGTRG